MTTQPPPHTRRCGLKKPVICREESETPQLLSLPGRLVNHSGRHILRLPLNWPWKHTFTTAHQHLHNLPLLI